MRTERHEPHRLLSPVAAQDLAHRAKLLANAWDRASTTVLSLGIFAPIASGIYDVGVSQLGRLVAWFVIWVIGAVVLHSVARFLLGWLANVGS